MTLDDIDTPALVLDRSRLEANLQRMRDRMTVRGVRLRPHLKTAKSLDVALLATRGDRSAPVTVSTLLEAEQFFGWGFTDLFYAVCLGPGKVARAARLLQKGAKLVVCVDSAVAAAAIVAEAARAGVTFRATVELDCGEGRGGVTPEGGDLLELARLLGPHFAGVVTHAGHSYASRTPAQLLEVAKAEARTAQVAAERLALAGQPCAIVSIGSSPTALDSANLAGITEIRAGVYMFWDLFQAGNGQCSLEDIAVSVLTEVIGRPAGRNDLIIDAGAFALTKDLSTAALPPEKQAGFGLVCDIDGRVLPGWKVSRVWQEHGLIVSPTPLAATDFPVGTRLRILPNHACPTAAAHARYQVVAGSRQVDVQWPRFTGW